MKFEFSKHALAQMKLRNISKEKVESMLRNPGQIITQGKNKIYQSIITENPDEKYLIRAFVNENKTPPLIITVYRTTKINKYYEGEI